MRVLLTGAAGFIGSTIHDQLRAGGHDVVSLDLLLPAAHGRSRPRWSPPDLIVGDVRDEGLLLGLLDGVDAVCHQAAMVGLGTDASEAPDFVGHNVLGTASLLSAMARAGVRRFVQASSMVVYGEGGYRCADHGPARPGRRTRQDLDVGLFDPPCPTCGASLQWETVAEDAPLDPRHTYAVTKTAQEQLAAGWAEQIGASVTSLRYHNVYGPRMPRETPYAGVASIFRSALAGGVAPHVFEDGRQRRDFIHVSDVARANLLALQRATRWGGDGPEVLALNIASGTPHTVGEMASSLAEAMGGPEPIIVGGGRPGDVRHVVADPAAAGRVLGFQAQIGFTAGMTEFAGAEMRESAGVP